MPHRSRPTVVAAALLTFAPLTVAPVSAIAAVPYDDTFSDDVVGPNWTRVIDDAAHLNLIEQAGHLQLKSAAGGTANDDAIYLSTFRLSTATDFVIRLDYSITGFTPPAGPIGSALGLVFGVGYDTDGKNSAAVGQGFGTVDVFGNGTPVTGPAATVGYRINDAGFGPTAAVSLNTTGTFEIAYNAAGDDLTLRRVGGGVSYTVVDTVRTIWGAPDLLVSFGGRGSDFAVAGDQAYVDNFVIVSGNVVPEPGCLTLLGMGAMALGRRRSGAGR